MAYKAFVTPYDMHYDGEIYTITSQLGVLDWEESGDTNYVFVYATATTLNPLLPNWRSRVTSSINTWAEDNEVEIDQVLFLPDFSLLGL